MENLLEISISYTQYDILFQKDAYAIIKVKTSETDKVPKAARTSTARDNKSCTFKVKGYLNPNPLLHYVVKGNFENDNRGGIIFKVLSTYTVNPTTQSSVIQFLKTSIDGCGMITAKKIWNAFGKGTFDVLDNHPERLSEVKGLSSARIEKIISSYKSQKTIQLIQKKVTEKESLSDCLKIYKVFKEESLNILENSPYSLFKIDSFPFQKVDNIAKLSNCPLDDEDRIRGAITTTLKAISRSGDLFLEQTATIKSAYNLLNEGQCGVVCNYAKITKVFCDMAMEGKLKGDNGNCYLPEFYNSEVQSADIILNMIADSEKQKKNTGTFPISSIMEKLCKEMAFSPSEQQSNAVIMAVSNSFSILTGKPGTGKTTTLKLVLKTVQEVYSIKNEDVLLLAPTGRASRRMGESVGTEYEARTIHSALRIGCENDELEEVVYASSESTISHKKMIVVDEVSMLGQKLLFQLLQSINKDCRVLLVGDSNQLPSVEAGNVLAELISCGCVAVTTLTEIFRQKGTSLIVENAHRILNGETTFLYDNNFQLIEAKNQEEAANIICDLYKKDPNIQILSPVRKKGEAGTNSLNTLIQSKVNPNSLTTPQIKRNGVVYRVGDKVIQNKNVTFKDEDGNVKCTISNGDTGVIRKIFDEEVTIEFQDETIVYNLVDLDNISLAYAITIHKSQGSEYPTVVIPIVDDKLFNFTCHRNLIYTGITRGKSKVILVGSTTAIAKAINSNKATQRNTMLAKRISDGYDGYKKSIPKKKQEKSYEQLSLLNN